MPTIIDLFEYHRPHFMLPIQAWMEERGLEYVGQGAKSAAFRNKNGEIVKVFEDDPCYRAFVTLVKNHTNPHFPVLRKIAAFPHPSLLGAFMIKIEPLEHLSANEFRNNLSLHCYIIIEHNMYNYGNHSLYVEHIPMTYISDILNGNPMFDSSSLKKARQLADQFQKEQPLFVQALNLVMFNKHRPCRIDLHGGNFMKRGDTWVITDPYIR